MPRPPLAQLGHGGRGVRTQEGTHSAVARCHTRYLPGGWGWGGGRDQWRGISDEGTALRRGETMCGGGAACALASRDPTALAEYHLGAATTGAGAFCAGWAAGGRRAICGGEGMGIRGGEGMCDAMATGLARVKALRGAALCCSGGAMCGGGATGAARAAPGAGATWDAPGTGAGAQGAAPGTGAAGAGGRDCGAWMGPACGARLTRGEGTDESCRAKSRSFSSSASLSFVCLLNLRSRARARVLSRSEGEDAPRAEEEEASGESRIMMSESRRDASASSFRVCGPPGRREGTQGESLVKSTIALRSMLPSGARRPAARRRFLLERLILCRAEGEESIMSIDVSIETSFISHRSFHAKAVAERAAGEKDCASDAITTSFFSLSTPTPLNLNLNLI